MLGELLVGLTRVEIVKKRNTEAACKGCHALIDPVGIGFVQFDHTGRYDANIDGSGVRRRVGAARRGRQRGVLDARRAGEPSCRRCREVSACVADEGVHLRERREPVRADTLRRRGGVERRSPSSGNSFPAMLRGLVDAAQPSGCGAPRG